MDRFEIRPSLVGVVSIPPGRIHKWEPMGYQGGHYYSNCGRIIQTLADLHMQLFNEHPICKKCFGRNGVISYMSFDRYAVIEFFEQEKLDV